MKIICRNDTDSYKEYMYCAIIVEMSWSEMDTMQEIKKWCSKTFVRDQYCCFSRDFKNVGLHFYFSNEEDRNWFMLRWS